MAGRLLGIARKPRPYARPETIERARVSFVGGIEGDYRGGMKPRGRRQVTIMQRSDWAAALADLGDRDLAWSDRRVNMLCDDIELPRDPGTLLRVGEVLFEITGECDPCRRMDAVSPGLFAALIPDWRGGRLLRVRSEGTIAAGAAILIEERLARAI
ncbi:MOSC domain-containing protein [Sphingomonas sp.]|uniref:MOSC domain-containing protein n=1 Tax=Sphingomonas sp. TaxID=28214 RepID=UPI003B00AF02